MLRRTFVLFWLAATLTRAQTLPTTSTLKQLSFDQLLEIEVTSVSLRPEKLSETASAIQVITAEDVRRSGATSIPEALRLATNLEVAQIDSRQWAISARGFNNLFADKLLVLADGRSLYTPLYAGVYWDVQDTVLADLQRIEVISGPGATQWGANAVNGVVNVTTKSAQDTQGGLVVAGAGTELRNDSEVRYGGRLGANGFYRVYAKYLDRSDSVRPQGNDSGDAWRKTQVGFRSDWLPRADTNLTLQGDAYLAHMGQIGPDNITASGANVLGRWSRTLGDNSDVRVQAYYDYTHRRIPASFAQDIGTYDLDIQYRRPIGAAQDLLTGVGYRFVRDSVVNTPANAFIPPEVHRQLFNVFAQDEIALVRDRLHLTLGSKVEHNDYTGFEFEPSVRLAWTPTRQQTVWTALSRAVRTPSRIDRDLYSPATPPYRIAGGQNVVSEKLLASEMGYRVQIDPAVALSVATFLNNYGDLRSLEPLNPPRAFPVKQSSGWWGRSEGIELTVEWRVNAAWRLHAGWTELRVRSEPQAGSRDRGTRDSIARDPNRQLQLRSIVDIGKRCEFDTDVRYVANINRTVPGYTEADVRFGWQPTERWDVSIVGQNLLHVHHAEFNPAGARREIQRGIFSKFTWRF